MNRSSRLSSILGSTYFKSLKSSLQFHPSWVPQFISEADRSCIMKVNLSLYYFQNGGNVQVNPSPLILVEYPFLNPTFTCPPPTNSLQSILNLCCARVKLLQCALEWMYTAYQSELYNVKKQKKTDCHGENQNRRTTFRLRI